MTELHWRAATDAGSYDGTALISVGQGAVHLRTDLPAGTLENAVATLSWPMAENEKIFMNGYQTWTECPELPKWGRQRGTDHIPKFLLDKYRGLYRLSGEKFHQLPPFGGAGRQGASTGR